VRVRDGNKNHKTLRVSTLDLSLSEVENKSIVSGEFRHSGGVMVFEKILQLQRNLTDKFVVVDDSLPELKRFSGLTGTVKTVNFTGRALVQFDGNNNIGWYDIDPKFLKVVDAPLPKVEKDEKKAAPKAEASKAETSKEKGAAKPSAAPKAGGSVADILAAARGGAKPAMTPAPVAEKVEKPAVDAKKMSTADVLASLRSKSAPAKPEAVPVAKKEVAPAPIAAQVEEVKVTPVPATKPQAGSLPKDVAGIVAYCRKVDAK
jgi:hypothetical protein